MSKKYIFAYDELLELEECSGNVYWWHCPKRPGLPRFDPYETKLYDTKKQALEVARNEVDTKFRKYKALSNKINSYLVDIILNDNTDN